MSARRTTLLFLSLALVAAALSLGTAEASAGTPGSAYFDICAYAQADMTEWLVDGNQETLATPSNSYCGFITDVYVPATAVPVPFYLEGGTGSVIGSASVCNALTVKIMIYKKAESAAASPG